MEKRLFRFNVGEGGKDKRIDRCLVENLPGTFSRSFLQKLIAQKNVLLNGSPVKSHHRVSEGDSIEVRIPELVGPSVNPESIKLDIVYEDEELAVVNKPRGMVVHPAPGNYSGTLVNALLAHCKDLSGIGGVMKPGIVHRLDKETSGVLVVAKTDRAHKALAKQFKAHSITRKYAALVKGVVELDNGIIELPIGRHSRDRKRMAVNFVNSRDAVTQYKVLRRFEHFTLVEVTLRTGRTHQIRVHMSYIGHPILGDEKYGSRGGLSGQALHAKTLGFVHPATNKYVEFTSEMPDEMKELISKGRL